MSRVRVDSRHTYSVHWSAPFCVPWGRRGGTKPHAGRREGVVRTTTARETRDLRLFWNSVRCQTGRRRSKPFSVVIHLRSRSDSGLPVGHNVLAAQHERPVLQGHEGSDDDEARNALMTPRQEQVMTENHMGFGQSFLNLSDGCPFLC